jgi:hypothetical protein
MKRPVIMKFTSNVAGVINHFKIIDVLKDGNEKAK